MAENATKCCAADGGPQIFNFCHGMPLMVRAADFNALYSEAEKLRKDAERYRWLKSRQGLTLRSEKQPNVWKRMDGTEFSATHSLAEGGTQHAPADSMDALIDAAMPAARIRDAAMLAARIRDA